MHEAVSVTAVLEVLDVWEEINVEAVVSLIGVGFRILERDSASLFWTLLGTLGCRLGMTA